MIESKLTYLVDPLREMIYQFGIIIQGYRERNSIRIAGLTCGMFPEEIPACAGLVPLRLPHYSAGSCICEGISAINGSDEIYDTVAVPRGCSRRDSLRGTAPPVHEFESPCGWGAEAAGIIHSSLKNFLNRSGRPGPGLPDESKLRPVTQEYNAMRRLVRGISSVRRDKPDLLSCRDLSVVFEAAAVFPPAVIIDHLASILKNLNSNESDYHGGMIPALAYASFMADAMILDEIEEAGCLIVEDDFCSGRRQFEMSYDTEVDNLLIDMIDSYSYRPRCASVRPVEERNELFYKMMKNQGIELVIFIEDRCCPAKRRDIEALRIRLMRSGIDPIVVTSANAPEIVGRYMSRI